MNCQCVETWEERAPDRGDSKGTMDMMPLECPVRCLSGRCSTNSFVSNEESAEGWRLCWDRTSGQGLQGPPVVARDSELVAPALPTPGGPLTQNG